MRKLSFPLFVICLIFAPLAFGSVETWSIAIVELLVFSSLFFLVFPKKRSGAFFATPGIVPLLLLVCFIFLQLIPLPANFVNFIAPQIYKTYAPILDLQETKSWIPLTVNQKATLLEFIRISCYTSFYILTVQLLSKKDRLLKTVHVVVYLAIGIAFLAILQKFTSDTIIYWLRPAPQDASPGGPWVYRNHYAGFMELVFPLVLALFFYHRPKVDKKLAFRARMAAFLSTSGSNFYFLLGFGAILILCSVFVTLSRGGTIAINLGLLLFFLLLRQKSSKSKGGVFFLAMAIVFLAVGWMGWDPILSRFNSVVSATGEIQNGRLFIWQDCAPMIHDYFFTGSGFATFTHAFPRYSTIPSSALFDHAHNDYIELLTDGGLIGFSLAAWFVLAIFRNGINMLQKRRDTYSILLSIAGITALFSILLHSITDFNMHNGANGLYFFFLCGLLVSAGNTRLHFRSRPTLLRTGSATLRTICFLTLPLFFLTFFVQNGVIKAKKLQHQAEQVYVSPKLSTALFTRLHKTIDQAIEYDPLEGYYYFYKGGLFSARKQGDDALRAYSKASMKNPNEGAYLQRLALSLPPQKIRLANTLMEEGYLRSQNKEELIFSWIEWLLQQRKPKQAAKALQQGIKLYPNLAKALPLFLLSSDYTKESIASLLPRKASPWIQTGHFLEKMGKLEDAEFFRLHALDFLDQEETVKPHFFNQIYSFYKRHKKEEEAIEILRRGIEASPDYPSFHISLGDYYRKQGINYRALEEYKQALFLDPRNIRIQQRINKIEKQNPI